MTGQDLREHRLKAGVMSWVLGAEMGVAASRISQVENQMRVSDTLADRYLAALDRCVVKRRWAEAKEPETAA